MIQASHQVPNGPPIPPVFQIRREHHGHQQDAFTIAIPPAIHRLQNVGEDLEKPTESVEKPIENAEKPSENEDKTAENEEKPTENEEKTY